MKNGNLIIMSLMVLLIAVPLVSATMDCADNDEEVYVDDAFGPTKCCDLSAGIKPNVFLDTNSDKCISISDGVEGTCVVDWDETCGNGACSDEENKCNCPDDCSETGNQTAKTSPCGDYGDVNNDGYITQEDVDILSEISVGIIEYPSAWQFERGDVTGNGEITGTDVSRVSRYLNGYINTFSVCDHIDHEGWLRVEEGIDDSSNFMNNNKPSFSLTDDDSFEFNGGLQSTSSDYRGYYYKEVDIDDDFGMTFNVKVRSGNTDSNLVYLCLGNKNSGYKQSDGERDDNFCFIVNSGRSYWTSLYGPGNGGSGFPYIKARVFGRDRYDFYDKYDSILGSNMYGHAYNRNEKYRVSMKRVGDTLSTSIYNQNGELVYHWKLDQEVDRDYKYLSFAVGNTEDEGYGRSGPIGKISDIKIKTSGISEECMPEGGLTNPSLGPQNTPCCEGLEYFSPDPNLIGAPTICYDESEGEPKCLYHETGKEGWYYSNGELLRLDDCHEGYLEEPDSPTPDIEGNLEDNEEIAGDTISDDEEISHQVNSPTPHMEGNLDGGASQTIDISDEINADSATASQSGKLSKEEIEHDVKKEIKPMINYHGAKTRFLQLQKSILKAIEGQKQVINYAHDKYPGCDLMELLTINSELSQLYGEVRSIEISGKSQNELAEIYVDKKDYAKKLVKLFKDEAHSIETEDGEKILGIDDVQLLRNRVTRVETDEIREIDEEIENYKKKYNAEQVKETLKRVEVEDADLVEAVQKGEVNSAEIKEEINKKYKLLPDSVKKEAVLKIKESETRADVKSQDIVEKVTKELEEENETNVLNQIKQKLGISNKIR